MSSEVHLCRVKQLHLSSLSQSGQLALTVSGGVIEALLCRPSQVLLQVILQAEKETESSLRMTTKRSASPMANSGTEPDC
jgi:hypothetical protein